MKIYCLFLKYPLVTPTPPRGSNRAANGKTQKTDDKTETIKQRIARYENDEISIEFLNRRGIPEQYGIFYAMGGATIFETLLTTCYHVCPAHESFQFDTTFMYILAVLIFVKFYQFRHPDITADAYFVFLIIGLSLIMETISYYSPPGYYLPIFVAMYLIIKQGQYTKH